MDLTRVRARTAELLAEYRIPSAVIGVLCDGRVTTFAEGVKDVRSGEPATTETIYQIGSMTKTWTALAFMRLADEGRVDLDEPVRTYLPGFRVADPEASAKVTPRHLLDHTNGIEESFGDPGEGDDVLERMVAGIADAPQVHPLGQTHGYSAALGYAILGRIMEVVEGARWDDIMRDRLFGPLGLTGTSTRPGQVDRGRAATGHIVRSRAEGPIGTPLPYLPRAFGPGGNVNSTAGDVLALAYVLLNGGKAPDGTRIASPEAVSEMTRSRVPVPDPYMFGPEWGLGLIVCDWHGHPVYAHDGSTVGQNARLRILPNSGIALTMLTNGGPREPFYREVFNEILAESGAVTIPGLPKPVPGGRIDLSAYVGVYERPGTRYEVTAEDGRLYLTFAMNAMEARFLGKPERVRRELLPVGETHFLMPSDDPLEDTQTVAIYDFTDGGPARYLHTNCRVNPRTG
ncbi:serine hydrolase [Spongiactinospora gelatinilytica]|uniref:Serine hydrolase n=1 Tax=Spongiactinospora gelatinilytica TaxID=2666298 RepID=A0A2W2H4Q7_9ACTN|nr:serine hydrolase [Spongiactinospora gelatinilytica]PZG46995.1 serine hydrolase [Spongiactinospora gelatinilytica]